MKRELYSSLPARLIRDLLTRILKVLMNDAGLYGEETDELDSLAGATQPQRDSLKGLVSLNNFRTSVQSETKDNATVDNSGTVDIGTETETVAPIPIRAVTTSSSGRQDSEMITPQIPEGLNPNSHLDVNSASPSVLNGVAHSNSGDRKVFSWTLSSSNFPKYDRNDRHTSKTLPLIVRSKDIHTWSERDCLSIEIDGQRVIPTAKLTMQSRSGLTKFSEVSIPSFMELDATSKLEISLA